MIYIPTWEIRTWIPELQCQHPSNMYISRGQCNTHLHQLTHPFSSSKWWCTREVCLIDISTTEINQISALTNQPIHPIMAITPFPNYPKKSLWKLKVHSIFTFIRRFLRWQQNPLSFFPGGRGLNRYKQIYFANKLHKHSTENGILPTPNITLQTSFALFPLITEDCYK